MKQFASPSIIVAIVYIWKPGVIVQGSSSAEAQHRPAWRLETNHGTGDGYG